MILIPASTLMYAASKSALTDCAKFSLLEGLLMLAHKGHSGADSFSMLPFKSDAHFNFLDASAIA